MIRVALIRAAAQIGLAASFAACATPPPPPRDARPSWERLPLAEIPFASERARARARTHALSSSTRLAGHSRATISLVSPFDYASLPVLPPMERVIEAGAPSSSASPAPILAIVSNPREHSVRIDSSRSAAIEAHVGATVISRAETPLARELCDGRATARWLSIEPGSFTEEALTFSRSTGIVSRACQAWPDHRVKSVAPSLWRGLFYAYRECVTGCDDVANPAREERLVVLAPPARFVAATFDTPEQMLEAPNPVFSSIALPIRRGSAASVVVDLSEGGIASFLALRGADPWWESNGLPEFGPIHASIDVVWAEDDAAPRATLLLGATNIEGGALLEAMTEQKRRR